jgi:hypothetical protein
MRLVPYLLLASAALASAQTADEVEFFEKRVRPVLADKCYVCHSAETMAAAELRLDTREATRRGGSRGPAVAPGDPAASVLLRAVSYDDLDLKMPPAGKLSGEEIAALRAWIEMGAPDPREERTEAPAAPAPAYDFTQAREFWAFRPPHRHEPPAVRRADWVASPVDAFLLAKLEETGLEPAPAADKRTLIRRAAYDLTGMPPTPEEVAAFLADESPEAWKRLVERLLASPAYGERWGRHWLDLVRFAETNGHEFDNDKLDAWRYRDWVVDAFNRDLPYNRFVAEQIAGDLLADRRLSADDARVEGPVGAGMWWLWEVLNSPTDSEKARADQIDNQIDVLGKAFFGLTLACARCHDHKFDPIPTADYYAIAGVLHSTRLRERSIDSPARAAELRRIRDLAVGFEARRPRPAPAAEQLLSPEPAWAEHRAYAATEPSHPLYPLAKLAEGAGPFAERLRAMRTEMREWAAKSDPAHPLWRERGDIVWEEFSGGYERWNVEGAAFGDAPAADRADSFPGRVEEFVGILATRPFTIPSPHVHVRMSGTPAEKARKELAPVRFTLWADDHPSQNWTPPESGREEWVSIPLVKEKGRSGYLQIVDRARDGHIAVDRIVFSESIEPPPVAGPVRAEVLALLDEPGLDSLEALARAYARLANSTDDRELAEAIAGPLAERRAVRPPESVPESSFALSSMDHDPRDVRIHQRGNHKNLGEEVPRRFLTVIAGEEQPPFARGSGRLELAEWAASERNPLTARVMANRVWKHHFGEGIVRSPDNFGETGDRPTHPELLDDLAARFMESGWSLKELHRLILMSNAYRMDSRASDEARRLDPENKFLSRMPVRRLEAEAVRDAMLVTAGTLDRRVGGPSVPPHISPYQDGRGKPASGPLDGEGRRSLYIQVRRNFLTPLFLAFDYPQPFTTIGRRGVSAVPSQALMLLNNEFVQDQAAKWAQRELEVHADRRARLAAMFERAFGRPPAEDELREVGQFVAEQAALHGAAEDDPRVWSYVAYVLLNSTEFVFVR